MSSSRPHSQDSFLSRLRRYVSSDIWSILVAIIGLVVVTVTWLSPNILGIQQNNAQQPAATQEDINELRSEIAAIRADVDKLEVDIQAFSQLPSGSETTRKLNQLKSSLDELEMRESKLEDAILDNPAKALEIPLLQRDLDSVRTNQEVNFLALRDAVGQVYDLNKWLLGAMAISIITLAISNFLKGKEKP
jgi:septal ring factor EnvC (AmiA/AmiB activator)